MSESTPSRLVPTNGANASRAEPAAFQVLVVDDDASACRFLEQALAAEGLTVRSTTDPELAVKLALEPSIGAVITDLNMPKLPGIELCRRLAQQVPGLPVVVVTAFGSVDSAVAAMKAGAYDFVTKPFEVEAVALTLARALQHSQLKRELSELRAAVANSNQFGEMLGASDSMRAVYDLIERVSGSDAPILVTGESGTGKELVARELHRRGSRASGPLVAINCAAMPDTLLESELFGHVRGAFTDARTARDGLFVQAHKGTIFLDEIGDMPLSLQPKLLRALQEGCVRPVGGLAEVPFDARIISATNRDLETGISERTFREDLFYRINVVHIALPPLSARGADVLLLARTLLARLSAKAGKRLEEFSPEASKRLLEYDWPGNVRELRNCVERAVALARTAKVELDDLPPKIRDYSARHVLVVGNDPSELVPLEEVERRYILRVLDVCQGNKSMAAQVLGLNRKTLHRRLEGFGGEVDESEADSEI